MVVSINFYNQFELNVHQGDIDCDGDTFDIILMSSSHTFTATHTQKSDVSTNEIAQANGYLQGAETLASVTLQESSGTLTFDAADSVWTASGGSIAADDGVIYSETAINPTDPLMCSIDFDGTQTAVDGTDFRITYNASGIFTVA